MGLETVTNVGDLVATNPTSSDQKSQGDDHLRNVKAALRQSFAGFTSAVCVTGTDGGIVNAYTLTPATALLSYGTKMIAVFAPTVTNTGAVTMNISGLGAVAIKSVSGAALVSGDLVFGSIYTALYNGTEFRLLSITKNYADQLAFSTALPAQALGLLISTGTVASFSTTTVGFALNAVRGADIAAASTINLTTATGEFDHITGAGATIGTITIPVGASRLVLFEGINTLTNSASLLLPGGVNITTAANDMALIRGDASGALVAYFKADGTAVVPSPTGAVSFYSYFTFG